MLGIDIYNGTRTRGLDLARVKAAGYGFTIVKATEGVDYVDPSFIANVQAAHVAGLLVGAYHLLRATPIDRQCHDFLAAIAPHGPYACLAIDVENPSAGSTEISSLGKSAITDRILTIYKAIRAEGYTCPVYVYASASWLRSLIDVAACRKAGMLIWMAAYSNDTPDSTDWSAECDMWQWCSDGNVQGVTGNTDCDVCYRGIAAAPSYTCDTSGTVEIERGKAYQALITSAQPVSVVAGTLDVVTVLHRYDDGDKRYYYIVPIGQPGDAAGIYINGSKAPQFVARVK